MSESHLPFYDVLFGDASGTAVNGTIPIVVGTERDIKERGRERAQELRPVSARLYIFNRN